MTPPERKLLRKIKSIPLKNSLRLIRGVMENMWVSGGPRIIHDFTDHGEKHCERLAAYAIKLLEAHRGPGLNESEAYLLMAGIYLHDIGMQVDVVKRPKLKEKAEALGAEFNVEFAASTSSSYSLEEQKATRKNHHYLSAAWIDRAVQTKSHTLSIPSNLVEDLMDVCCYHTKLDIADCGEDLRFVDGRKQFVAALLRFADELDIESTRVDFSIIKDFSLAPENEIYWWFHNMTEILIKEALVTMRVLLRPEDFDDYATTLDELLINRFREKNRPVLDVLAKNSCAIRFSDASKVTAYNYADPLPENIKAIINDLGPQKGVAQAVPSTLKLLEVEQTPDQETSTEIPVVPSLPDDAWLVQAGFRYDPFIYERAEQVPDDMLEETFVDYPGFEEIVFWRRSSVLLASSGSGKTASRRRLVKQMETRWLEAHEEDDQGNRLPPILPVIYSYSDILAVRSTKFVPSWNAFTSTFLIAVGRAILTYIEKYPQIFLKLPTYDREYWWSFLKAKATNVSLNFRLNKFPELLADFRKYSNGPDPHPEPSSSLLVTLEYIVNQRMSEWGFKGICFIMDGLDGDEDLGRAATLLATLLNAKPLLQMRGLVFKFFLPSELEKTVVQSKSFKDGDLQQVSFNWDVDSLVELLTVRLDWASDYKSLESLAEQSLLKEMAISGGDYIRLDDRFADLALQHMRYGPPKALLHFGQILFKVWKKAYYEIGVGQEAVEQQTPVQLTVDVWNNFIEEIGPELRIEDQVPSQIAQPENTEIEGDLEPFTKKPEATIPELPEVDLSFSLSFTELREKIVEYFTLDEIRTLCQDLGINPDEFPKTVTSFVTELVYYCRRRGILGDLLAICREIRPNVDWD